jgi:type IV pilus assembly protein PilA
MDRLRKRLAASEGFTLIELLVVIVIIGILLAIAVPSYLGFRNNALDTSAKANVRAAIPAAEGWYANNGTYATLTTANLKTIDSGVSPDVSVSGTPTASNYCLTDGKGSSSTPNWYYYGPGGTITSTKPAGC